MHVYINIVACSSMVSKPLLLFEWCLKRVVETKKCSKVHCIVLQTNLHMPRLSATQGVHEPLVFLSCSVRRFCVIIIAILHVLWTVHVQAMLGSCYGLSWDHHMLHYMRAKWSFTLLCKDHVFPVVWRLHTVIHIHSTVKLAVINRHTLTMSWQIYPIQLYCNYMLIHPRWATAIPLFTPKFLHR